MPGDRHCVVLGIQAMFPVISLCVCYGSLWFFSWFCLSELCLTVAVHLLMAVLSYCPQMGLFVKLVKIG